MTVQTNLPDLSGDALEILEYVAPYTMTSAERIYALISAIDYVVKNEIPGDVVECGVWRGGSMMAAARSLLRLGHAERKLYLFDTYEGMPPPEAMDKDIQGNSASDLMQKQGRDSSMIWAISQLEDVTNNMQSTGYPRHMIEYVKGRVEETIPVHAPNEIALLRLDTDWYASTRHELIHLFPRLSPGGVLIIDDYGHWQGAKLAVDEYISELNIPLLLCRIDYTGRIAVKQGR